MELSLQEIGLTEGETKVYLALLGLGATKTGPLAAKAGVSSSKVYKILDRLEKKGLAGHALKGKTKYYSALETKRIIEYIETQERQLQVKKQHMQELLPQLEAERLLSGQKTEAVIYDGLKAIKGFFLNILDDLKAGETYYVLGAHYGEGKGTRAFFHNYHNQRAKKKIRVKMLANHETRDNLEPSTYKNASVRFLPQYLMTDMIIVVYKNKSFMFLLTKDPKGFLIQSKEAATSFKTYFDTLWKMGAN